MKKRSWYTRAGHRVTIIFLYAVVSTLIAFAFIGMAFIVIDNWGTTHISVGVGLPASP